MTWSRHGISAVLVSALVGSLSGRAAAHPAACFPDRTVVTRATLYDSNGAFVGTALTGQVVYVIDEPEDRELVEVEVHLFGGLKVWIEPAVLAGFTRAEIPVYRSPKGQGWWGQNAPVWLIDGDARSALVAPHPNARTREMEKVDFVARKLSCAGMSGVPSTPLKNGGCTECATEAVPVPDPGPPVWWWWDQSDEDVFPWIATSTVVQFTKAGKPLMHGHLVESAIAPASSHGDGGVQDSYGLVETLWGPLRRRDLITRSRLLFEEPKKELHGRASGDLCAYYEFGGPALSDADIALIAKPTPFRFFEKGKDVLTLPPGTKVHVEPSGVQRERIGLHWPSDENPLLTLTGWIPSGHVTDRKPRPSDEEKKGSAFHVPARHHHRKKTN